MWMRRLLVAVHNAPTLWLGIGVAETRPTHTDAGVPIVDLERLGQRLLRLFAGVCVK